MRFGFELTRMRNHQMQRRTGGQFSRMDARLPVPADPDHYEVLDLGIVCFARDRKTAHCGIAFLDGSMAVICALTLMDYPEMGGLIEGSMNRLST